jgi:hypothetical protein
VAYVRTVKTSSGATAVQIVWSSRRGSRSIEHLGSAHDQAQLEAFKAAAAQRLAEGQGSLDLGLDTAGSDGEPLEILSSQSSHLWEALCRAYGALGFDAVLGGDRVLRDLVLARIIEPTSKIDAERVLGETGLASASYRTVKRRLPVIAKPAVRQSLSAACAVHAGLGPASLVLFDVSTLYFETDTGDGFRESGFSKERRLEPQITIGLLTDASGLPLAVEAFEGNKAETATMVPVINAFKAAHKLNDVTVVADAGMISESNQIALHAAGLSYILGARIPFLPDVVREWRDKHPGAAVPDQLVMTQPWPATSSEKARGIPDRVTFYQYRHDRARRSLRGIDQEHQPGIGGQESSPGGMEGLHHQPHQPVRGVRHRRLPRALAHREGLPNVQARSAGPSDLPPHPRIDRGSPDDRVRRDGRQPLHRNPNQLEHQEIRPHRPPLPHRPNQSRPTNPHRRRPPTRRPPQRPRRDRQRTCALVWPNSG